MLVPLFGFLRGDCMGLLLLAQDDDTVLDVAERLQRAAAVRVAPAADVALYHQGQRLAPELTVAEAGLRPLDRVDVLQEPSR